MAQSRDEVIRRGEAIQNLLDTEGWKYVERYIADAMEGHKAWLLSVEAGDEAARIERERRLAVYKAWAGFQQVLQDWIRQAQEARAKEAGS